MHRDNRFLFLALNVPMQIFTHLRTSGTGLQLIDTLAIVALAGGPCAGPARRPHASEAYTSYMCNLYAIFAIDCIGILAPVHFETEGLSRTGFSLSVLTFLPEKTRQSEAGPTLS
jgi:hypothetical protein